MTKRLSKLIKKHHLAKRLDSIMALVAVGVRLKTTPAKSRLRIGMSKFGGDPDVPAGFIWPRRKSRPLHFIAQLDVESLPVQKDVKWPAQGSLLFFYAAEEQPWGFDPKDRGAWKIVYVPHGKARRRQSRPRSNRMRGDEDEFKIRECAITPSKCLSLPPPGNPALAAVLTTDNERLDYFNLYEELHPSEDNGHHQFLGWPQVVQRDMEVECQFAFHGINCGGDDEVIQTSPKALTYASSASRWQLILQVVSDDNLEVMWGDLGRLYFFATAETRASLKFNETWVVLQCG